MSEESDTVDIRDDTGLHEWLIDWLGWEKFVEMCRRFGGQKIYVPRRPYTEDRNREIRQHFMRIIEQAQGPDMTRVYESLAKNYGITVSGIRHILYD